MGTNDDLATLRATVERQGEAIRELAERLTHASADQAPALDTAGWLAVADILDGAALDAPAPDAGGERAPLGNIRVLPSQPLWDCVREWMKPCERADGYCPRCAVNRTGRVCDGCMGDLESILREMGPRWMRGPTPPADAPLPGPVADVGAVRKVAFLCNRCKRQLEGVEGPTFTGGFYRVNEPPWERFAQHFHENIVCDDCMHADPKYQAEYGTLPPASPLPRGGGSCRGRRRMRFAACAGMPTLTGTRKG